MVNGQWSAVNRRRSMVTPPHSLFNDFTGFANAALMLW
jgi:hypothetical protein